MNPLIRKYLDSYAGEAILISDKANVRYLTGFTGSNGQVIISKEKQEFLTDGRYTTQASAEISKEFKTTIYSQKYQGIAEAISNGGKRNKIIFEPSSLTVKEWEFLKSITKGVTWIPLKEEAAELRIVKSSAEIKLLKKAAKIAHEALTEILSSIKPGDVEKDLALKLEFGMRNRGAEGVSFEPIIASGVRSALPHGRASDKKIKSGELVTIDCGSLYNGYCSDETVTFVVGKSNKKQENIYGIVKEAHDLAIKSIKPGAKCDSIDSIARNYITEKGFGDFFKHRTGHGVGLEIHELPTLGAGNEVKLLPGMVITVEPGIYIPDWGGVRIEDTVLVTESGNEIITLTDKTFRCFS